MEIKPVASTKFGYVAPKEEFEKIGGLAAGVCYLPDTTEKLFSEPPEKTERRKGMIKASGHHSPFDHPEVMLDIVDIPKIAAMALNNEKMYTTSEKSARYKRMALPEDEQMYYDKWLEIFKEVIAKEYKEKCPTFFTDIKITKLAQENARYLTSVFTPTSMEYSTSYRQINVLYGMLGKEIEILKTENTGFALRLAECFEELNKKFEQLTYIDKELSDNRKDRSLSLIRRNKRALVEQFGDSYTTSYYGSFAQLAQAQRHRTIDYSLEIPEKSTFFVPPILEKYGLAEEWLKDCEALKNNFPQGMLVKINEQGTLDNFILKLKERNCTCAQLEIDRQSTATKKKYYEALKAQGHPAAEELAPYMKGSRCTFPNYKCKEPCGFADGVKGERLI